MSSAAYITFVALALLAAIGWIKVFRLRRQLRGIEASIQTLASHVEPSTKFRQSNSVHTAETTLDRLGRLFSDLRSDATLREQILSSMSEGVLLLESSGARAYENAAAGAVLGATGTVPPEVLSEKVVEFTVRLPKPREIRAVSENLPGGRRLTVIQDVTEARKIDSVRRDFVANVSHELKTPVAGILASAETLEVVAEEDAAGVPKFMGALLREARRLSKLVEDLLDLAKIEQQPPAVEPVDLSALVRAEIDQIREPASAKSLEIRDDLENGLSVLAAPEDLRLAISNILVNAVRHTERGGIHVRLYSDGVWGVFEVADTGVGIPAKDLPRIFERFYRVDKARSSQTGGTGLGLSIVKHAAERHGGEVSASSELGQGSTFTLRLPQALQSGQE